MLPFLIKYFKLALQTVALNTAESAEKSIIISF